MYDKQNIFWNMHMTLGTNLRITCTSKFTLACTFITYEVILWKSDSTALTNSECLHEVSYHCSPVIPPLFLPPQSGSTILFKGEDGLVVFNMAGTKSFYQGELFAAPMSCWIINIFQYSHALLAENSSLRTSSLPILIGKSVWYTID